MKRQSKLIVQGFPGSFHDEAARKYFGSRRIEVLPAKSFNELAIRLSSDHSINYGVMAIENSIAGSILQNYRILRENDFWISGETFLRIEHQLMALPDQDINDIIAIKLVTKHFHSSPIFIKQAHIFITQSFSKFQSNKVTTGKQL